MNKKILGKLKLAVTVVLILCFVWFLIVFPMSKFHQNEKKLEQAARRYFELNGTQLPVGDRVKTVRLQDLYHKSFIEGDIFIPYTKKTCSVTNSWVKVRQVNGEYKYYVYLQCGVLSSNIDHRGPEISLNGDLENTVNVGENYKDPGVKSVIDDSDGKLDIKDVSISGEVDTSMVGTYEISYTAYDKLRNKSEIVRKVKVVKKLEKTVKQDLGSSDNYTGNPSNNYIRLSNMMYRIYGIDANDNVVVVSDTDVANVNHSKIDTWLNYYYDHLSEKTKNIIVDSKYCNMDLTDATLDTLQCGNYTEKKKVYIPSVIEVNKAAGADGNFMKPYTMSWVSNKKLDTKEAYLTREVFFGDSYGKNYLSYDVDDNYGIRPMMTIKGSTLITGGNGTSDDPYVVGDTTKGRGGSLLNERSTGEYITDNGTVWRIIEVLKDGTTKAISVNTISNYNDSNEIDNALTFYPTASDDELYLYNPKDKNSVAYFINNTVVGYVDISKFVNHEIEVPIYKKKIVYGNEKETKKYKTILSAPNMYEMFSAASIDNSFGNTDSYWLLNSSKTKNYVSCITHIGVPYTGEIDIYNRYGIRAVGYFKDNITIISGSGTIDNPYTIK